MDHDNTQGSSPASMPALQAFYDALEKFFDSSHGNLFNPRDCAVELVRMCSVVEHMKRSVTDEMRPLIFNIVGNDERSMEWARDDYALAGAADLLRTTLTAKFNLDSRGAA